MQEFQYQGVKFAYHANGDDIDSSKPIIIWAHGWGHTHNNWAQIIAPLENIANHIVLDFPGFGESPPPPENWSTGDYADAVAHWIKESDFPPVIWVGHSFGCRVGLQIAANHPEQIKAMSLIAGAGLKRKRSLANKIYFYLRIKLFKLLRKLTPDGAFKDKLMSKFGSSDYKNAGAMRDIFIRVVNEDLSEQASRVKCPVTLVYGKNDTETPPEFGERFSKLIPNSQLFLLEGQDHYSVLANGRHQVIKILSELIKNQRI